MRAGTVPGLAKAWGRPAGHEHRRGQPAAHNPCADGRLPAQRAIEGLAPVARDWRDIFA